MRRAACLGAFVTLLASQALAQTPALQAVEQAYQSVDFPATHTLAERALQAGRATHAQTLRLYVLLGVSATALGNPEEAKHDFVVALAIEPRLKLDQVLSPKLREPYLEAQGYWAAAPDRLTVTAKASRDGKQLDVSLVDPQSLVASVELTVGANKGQARSKFVLEAQPKNRVEVAPRLAREGFAFTVRALDRYGNVMAEQGTNDEPVLAAPATPLPLARSARAVAEDHRSYLWPVLFGVGAFGAASAGALFHLQRERQAHEWNGPNCEKRGQTRLDQCRDLDAGRERSERWALALYGTSGVLLTGSLIALISGAPKDASAVDVGLIGCTLIGTAVSCDGRF